MELIVEKFSQFKALVYKELLVWVVLDALLWVMEPYLLGVSCQSVCFLPFITTRISSNTKIITYTLQQEYFVLFYYWKSHIPRFHCPIRLKVFQDVSFNHMVRGPAFCWTPLACLVSIWLVNTSSNVLSSSRMKCCYYYYFFKKHMSLPNFNQLVCNLRSI